MPGQQLALIQTVDTVRVTTFVSEKDINALRVGGEARVTTPGVRGKEYAARIESLGAKADSATGNFTVRLALRNEDGLLRDGMTARVHLQGLQYPDALLVPDTAVVDRNRRRVVYKVVNGKAVEVAPVLAATVGDLIPVLDGLQAGDRIIVEGLEGVVDGSLLVIRKEQAS
jgi:membrane fusion protein (multidrug efflux system)